MRLPLALLAAAAWGQPLTLHTVRPIDAHVHIFVNHPGIRQMLDRMDMRCVNITVLDPYEHGYEDIAFQQKMALEVFQATGGRAAWVSTFDESKFEEPGFARNVDLRLADSFRRGAVGVKIYKTIGMLYRTRAGKYVMPDDPAFAPVLDFIGGAGKTVYAHIAEPAGAWKALDPADPDYGYYKNNPSWHMYGHPERPSKAAILAARDRMIDSHPKLRIVGCHLGSMEEDVDEISKRLDRFPNFAVDTAARVRHLAIQPREKVRAFLLKYQDRVLYGTDMALLPGRDPVRGLRAWEAEIEKDWRYFATSDTLEYAGRKAQGLALPEPVLRKLFRENALRWVPGIETAR
jgi:predicted TIM-barrel fold metal-dependent hydrolase